MKKIVTLFVIIAMTVINANAQDRGNTGCNNCNEPEIIVVNGGNNSNGNSNTNGMTEYQRRSLEIADYNAKTNRTMAWIYGADRVLNAGIAVYDRASGYGRPTINVSTTTSNGTIYTGGNGWNGNIVQTNPVTVTGPDFSVGNGNQQGGNGGRGWNGNVIQ